MGDAFAAGNGESFALVSPMSVADLSGARGSGLVGVGGYLRAIHPKMDNVLRLACG